MTIAVNNNTNAMLTIVVHTKCRPVVLTGARDALLVGVLIVGASVDKDGIVDGTDVAVVGARLGAVVGDPVGSVLSSTV